MSQHQNSKSEETGFVWITLQVHRGGGMEQQELEAAGMTSTIRKEEQQMLVLFPSLSILYSLGSLPRERSCSHLRWVFQHQLPCLDNPLQTQLLGSFRSCKADDLAITSHYLRVC